jgi:hypothetical protein
MSGFENATKFFHACESLEGWGGCEQYVATDASFVAQCEPLIDITTVQGYADWMASLGNTTCAGCSYVLHASSYDEANRTAMFFATFTGTHVGDGGPVPPTNKTTNTDYVYVLTMDADDKVVRMCKVWNAPWAMRELGWV